MQFRFITALAAASFLTLGASATLAQQNPYQKGPAPTQSSVEAEGPFAVTTQVVKSSSGFAGGTIYVPTAAGTYGLVAVCPGFFAAQSSIAEMSKRLASHGFVVVAMSTITPFDLPGSRGNQLLAALRAVQGLRTGAVSGKVDPTRLAAAGWSMGGGGTIRAVESTPSLKTGAAWAPWAASNELSGSSVPLAIIGGSADTVAPVTTFGRVFYDAIPASTPKLLGVVRDADHQFVTTASQPASYMSVAWMKRFVDQDTRYSPFLNGDARLSEFRSSGPF